MAEYEQVSRNSLKLKGVAEQNIKKKKRKSSTEKKMIEQLRKSNKPASEADTIEMQEESKKIIVRKTPAQMAFEKMQEKRRMEKILEKASKTHKQRVEEFNHHLDSLSEHYDIPKVSWTK